MSEFVDYISITTSTILEERIRRLESQVTLLENRQANNYLLGRLRFDRTAPANSTDVQTPDALYDVVYTPTFVYILMNDAGAMTWLRYAVSTF